MTVSKTQEFCFATLDSSKKEFLPNLCSNGLVVFVISLGTKLTRAIL